MSPRLRNALDLWATLFVAIFGFLILGLALLVASPFLLVAWVAGGCE